MGIDPKIWGSSAWTIIHTTAFNAKTKEWQRIAKHMYYSFLYILPCDKCRKNYDTHLVNLPVPDSVEDLGKWSYTIHKRISPTLITFAEAKQKWSGHTLNVAEMVPFLDSIAATHPSARNIDSVYRDNLYNFIHSLVYFMGIPPISKTEIASRTSFKQWLKKLKKKYNIARHGQINQLCNVSCHV